MADWGFPIPTRNGYASAYFTKITVSSATFPTDGPDVIVRLPGVRGFSLANETTGSVIEVSFGGEAVEEELNGDSSSTSRMVQYDNRVVSTLYFRKKSGSDATIAIRAWV